MMKGRDMADARDVIVATVKLSRPAQRALAGAHIVTFADLSGWKRDDVAALHGIGPSSFIALDPALNARGLTYKTP